MKFLTLIAAVALPLVHGFPMKAMRDFAAGKLDIRNVPTIEGRALPTIPLPHVGIPLGVTYGRKVIPDAAHPYQYPGPTDQRGSCPGLNVLANYGYIPRNGIANIDQLVYAQMEVFGWAYDLSEFLAVLLVGTDGDPTTQSVSIGGPDSRTSSILSQSVAQGLGKHNSYEIDGSMSRDDAYFHGGETYVFNGTRWGQHRAIAAQTSNGLYDVNANNAMRDFQYYYCVANNPDCFWGDKEILFYGAQHFTYISIPSSDDGTPSTPTYDKMATFWGVTEAADGTYTMDTGAGKLPAGPDGNWYRPNAQLDITQIVAVAVESFLAGKDPQGNPDIKVFGGNAGKVNSFVADPNQLTNVTPSGALCFLYNAFIDNTPSAADSPAGALVNLVDWMNVALLPIIGKFGC